MIVWGDEDKIIPVQQTETWRKFIPNADIKIYKGAGHLVHLEKREAVDALGEVPELRTGRRAYGLDASNARRDEADARDRPSGGRVE